MREMFDKICEKTKSVITEEEELEMTPAAEEAPPEEEEKSGDIETDVLTFFQQNPNPSDDQLHEFAVSKGIEPDDVEDVVYKILSSILTGGKSDGSDDFGPDAEQLAMGIEVEKEHTDNEWLARKIALDHLAEISDYYTRLKKMEEEAKGNSDHDTEGGE